jgi:hypothetical protein
MDIIEAANRMMSDHLQSNQIATRISVAIQSFPYVE